jgi:hypothetical protein
MQATKSRRGEIKWKEEKRKKKRRESSEESQEEPAWPKKETKGDI